MNDPQKEAREIAARHGVQMYEPLAETKQEPGCECLVRAPLERIAAMFPVRVVGSSTMWRCQWCNDTRQNHDPAQLKHQPTCPVTVCRAALSAPCSCEQLRGERDQIWIKVEMLERVLTANATRHLGECEQLRERAAELEMARDVARDSAALWTKNAFTAVGELHVARSLLEEARLAISGARMLGELYMDATQSFDAILAKIEASRTPEVTK